MFKPSALTIRPLTVDEIAALAATASRRANDAELNEYREVVNAVDDSGARIYTTGVHFAIEFGPEDDVNVIKRRFRTVFNEVDYDCEFFRVTKDRKLTIKVIDLDRNALEAKRAERKAKYEAKRDAAKLAGQSLPEFDDESEDDDDDTTNGATDAATNDAAPVAPTTAKRGARA